MRPLPYTMLLAIGCGAAGEPSFLEEVDITSSGDVKDGTLTLRVAGAGELTIPIKDAAVSLRTQDDHGALTRFDVPLGEMPTGGGLTLAEARLGMMTPTRLEYLERADDRAWLRAHAPLLVSARLRSGEELGPVFTAIVDLDLHAEREGGVARLSAATGCARDCMVIPGLMMVDGVRLSFEIGAVVARP